MIKTTITVLAGVAVIAGVSTACTTTPAPTHATQGIAPVTDLNAAPLGGTLRVWHDAADFMDVTVSNVRFVDASSAGPQVERADVVVKSTQGGNTVGYFSGINAVGVKQDEMSVNSINVQYPDTLGQPDSQLDESGTMTQGETRQGTVDIPVLALTKVFLDSMNGPLATWNVR